MIYNNAELEQRGDVKFPISRYHLNMLWNHPECYKIYGMEENVQKSSQGNCENVQKSCGIFRREMAYSKRNRHHVLVESCLRNVLFKSRFKF